MLVVRAEAAGEDDVAERAYATVAAAWEQHGCFVELAYALLGLGRTRTALGRPAQAADSSTAPRRRSRTSVRARPSPRDVLRRMASRLRRRRPGGDRARAAFLRRVLPPPPARVLDVACGPGRHVRALRDLGYDAVGIELDDAVAAAARADGLDVRTLDMRELRSLDSVFDAVLSMWASFGFFDDLTNADVLRAMADKLGAEDVLVLDVYDPAFFGPRWRASASSAASKCAT